MSEEATLLDGIAADRSERPLTRAEAQRIHDYLAVVGTPADAIATMRRMKHGRSFDTALDRLARLTDRMDEQAIATGELVFAGTFGRDLTAEDAVPAGRGRARAEAGRAVVAARGLQR